MKRAIIKSVLLLCAAMMLSSSAFALVKPNGLFTDDAVLQRNIAVPVWGSAANGESVTVKFQDQEVSTVTKGGEWLVWLKPLKTGGPFEMTISGENTINLHNILVGEVWICSGQSNMEFRLNLDANAKKAIAGSTDPDLRLYTVPNVVSDVPLNDVNSSWQKCNPATSADFSAVGYYFGSSLRKSLGVPVGLINTSWGGSPAEAWMSRLTLKNNPVTNFVDELKGIKHVHYHPSVLYNAMISPLQPYAIAGAIWYQGETNANHGYRYRYVLDGMIQNWRTGWKQGDFPFLIVQLAPFTAIDTQPVESPWAETRESQLYVSQHTSKAGMAVITDVGDPNDIHPRQKQPVGERLAIAARGIAYGEQIVYSGPVYKSMKVDVDRAILSFDSVGGGLVCKGKALTGFTIAGADRKLYNANAQIVGDTVVVSSPDVKAPVAVRFGWSNCPVVNLWNRADLPASPFRTDDFPTITPWKN